MRQNPENSNKRLRRKAEQRVQETEPSIEAPCDGDPKAIIHELRVHQVELEMQNNELRQAQEDLQRSLDRYFILFNQAPVGYLCVDENGMIQKSNQTLLTLLDMDLDTMIHKPVINFIAEEDRNQFFGRFKAFFQTPVTRHMELRLIKSNQDIIHTLWSVQPAEPVEKSPSLSREILIAVLDMSKQAEMEAEKKEKERLKVVVELAGAVCHEIRQPLQVLLGSTELLSMKLSENDTVSEDLQRVRNQTQRINMALTRLDNITRYETQPYAGKNRIIDLVNASERRKNKRYMPKKSSFVQVSGHEMIKTQLIDISKGGLSFWADGLDFSRIRNLCCNVLNATGEILIENLQGCLIFDPYTEKNHRSPDKKTIAYRIKFDVLSRHQQDQLEFYINTHIAH